MLSFQLWQFEAGTGDRRMIKLSDFLNSSIMQHNIFNMLSGNILEYLKARPVRSHSHSDTDQRPSQSESQNQTAMANANSISRPAPTVVATHQNERRITRTLGTGNGDKDDHTSQPSPRNLLRWGCLKMTPAHPESRGEYRTARNEDRVSRSQKYAGPTKA
jgi:hypothetical protein